MRGGALHEQMIDVLEEALVATGAVVSRQVKTPVGYADLVADLSRNRLVVEVELTPRRVLNDLQKAATLRAWLWVVVPNVSIRAKVARRLYSYGVREQFPWLCGLTLGQAIERVKRGLQPTSSDGRSRQRGH